MRTIKENLLNRMAVQATEAELQGFDKVAVALSTQIEKHADHVRENDAFYVYSDQDFRKDVEDQVWSILVRAADFYGTGFDAINLQDIVTSASDDVLANFCAKTGAIHGVGAYEPSVPGEVKLEVSIEVEE